MHDHNRVVRQAIPATTAKDADEYPDLLPISDDNSEIPNLREVFGTIHIMMMSLLLQREHS